MEQDKLALEQAYSNQIEDIRAKYEQDWEKLNVATEEKGKLIKVK